MENNSFTASALRSPVRAQHGYPSHHPRLSYFPALVNRYPPEDVVNIPISAEEEPHSHTIAFGSLNVENQTESPIVVTKNHNDQDEQITVGDIPESLVSLGRNAVSRYASRNIRVPYLARTYSAPAPYLRGSALNIETLPEPVTGERISNNSIEEIHPVGLHQSITIREGEETEEEGEAEAEGEAEEEEEEQQQQNATNVAPYPLTMFLSLSGNAVFSLKPGKHTPLPLRLLYVVCVAIAFATYNILPSINDRSGYKKLKVIYYIACNLAFISELLMLFITT